MIRTGLIRLKFVGLLTAFHENNYDLKMKLILMVLIFSGLVEANIDLSKKILALPDYSQKVNVGLNSFPGANESIIFSWVREYEPQTPFYVRIEFGTIAGKTLDNSEIKNAVIYVVNPLKTTGFLWWKKYEFVILKEPDWTLFKTGVKNFDKKEEVALKNLLQ